MSGLNPSGTGQNRSFGRTEHESIETGELSNTVFIQGTSDIASVNTQLQNTPAGGVAHLVGTFTVGTAPVEIPSDTTVINWGTIRQADATSGTENPVLKNANASRTGTDTHITFINHGIIDGNAGNQPATNVDRHAVIFRGVDYLSFYGVRVVDPLDFAMRVEACNDVRFSNFSCEINFVEDHQDGLHFVDSNQVVGHGVSGVAEDDLLAITVDQDASISDYSIHGVEGTSLDADIVRINRSVVSLNDTTSKTLENISVTGIVGYNPAFDGVVLRDADANTTYRNVHVEAVIDNPGNSGLLAGQNAYYEDCSIDLTVRSPGKQGCLMNGVSNWKNGTIRVICRNEVGGSPSLVAANIESSTITLLSEIGGTTPHFHLQSGTEVEIDAVMDGSARGVQLGTAAPTAVTNSVIRGTAANIGQQDVIEIGGSGSNNNRVEMHGSGINVLLDGTTSTVNGVGTEDLGVAPTAAPTGSFPAGTTVRNSNADNNATWQLISGTWVQLA